MQKQEVTIYDVAREAKVSMATVSRVVNGNNNVRKETREKVLAVIDRLHYQPNAVAQGKWIPYYAFANRGDSDMLVWVNLL